MLAILRNAQAADGLNAIVFSAASGSTPLLRVALGNSTAGVPATTAMHFRLGMPAEGMETTLLLQLVDRGRLALDHPVSKWFPDYPNAQAATVRMLGASSAGFGDYVYGPGDPARGIPPFDQVLYANVFHEFTTAELIKRSQEPYQKPAFDDPGKDWKYSHTDFVVLGSILESASGLSYPALLRSFILTPLGLKDTAYASTPTIASPVLHAFTSERGTYEDSTAWNPSWTSYSGSVNSNVCDLASWTQTFGAGSLLSAQSAAELSAPTNVGLGVNTPALYFGLGTIVNDGWLVSAGNFFGWHTAAAVYPPTNQVIAFSLTEGPGTQNANGIANILLNRLSTVLTPNTPIVFPKK